MKRLLLMFALGLTIWSASAADIRTISSAFKEGNAVLLSECFDTEISLVLPDKSVKCRASEAISQLNAFFNHNKPNGFSVVHQADKKDNGFFVGKLPTSTAEYRVNLTYRYENNRILIESIRIE